LIVAGPGGLVGLLGGSASNSGTIIVPLGKVGLGSGEQATLDLTGDGFLQVAVPTNAKTADGQALVDVSGKIRAAGGSVQLKAATVASAIRDAVNVSGFVSASSAHASGGSIVLGGGPGGSVSATGRLVASGRSAGGRIRIAGASVSLRNARIAAQSRAGQGGTVTVKAGDAATLIASTIDVSAASGGGTVRIGGAQTKSVSIDSATTIKADATANGGGGAIVIRSGGQTAVHGILTAIGGPLGGDGGQIETSGKTVDFAALSVNASAALGKAGTWLLDPSDLIIDATLASEIDGILNTGVSGANVTLQTSATGAPTGATLTSGETNSAGNGDIIDNAVIAWSTAATLTLSAYHSIAIDAPITISGAGALVLTANNNVGGASSGGTYSFAPGQSASFTGVYTSANDGGNSALDGAARGALTINGTSFTLINSMAQLDAIDGVSAVNGSTVAQYGPGRGGAYALADNLTASASYTSALIGTFSGVLEGLGHAISGLSINAPNSGNVGLVGMSTGAVRDTGLLGGSIVGGDYVGALVGWNHGGVVLGDYATATVTAPNASSGTGGLVGVNDTNGAIVESYAAGAVVGQTTVGGLVGYNSGTITQAYATGAVTGEDYVGGLAGVNSIDSNSNGAISHAYATGAVVATMGQRGATGGFVGVNDGTIDRAYATGAVSGDGEELLGGFAGYNDGVITKSYYNVLTTGLTGNGEGASGLTTAQLQNGGLSSLGFNSAAWGGGANGIYPYLTAFFPSGVQTISGIAYADRGATPLGSPAGVIAGAIPPPVIVSALVNGTAVGDVTTGANGYYYILASARAIATTVAEALVTAIGSSDGAPVAGATLAENGSANPVLSGLDIYGNYLRLQTSPGATSLTATIGNLTTAAGNGAQPGSANALALLSDLNKFEVDATGANFSFDTTAPLANVPLGGSLDTLVVNSTGHVTQSQAIETPSLLLLGGGGSFSFTNSANQIATLATSTPGGAVALTTASALTIGAIEGVDGVTAGSVLAEASGDVTLAQAASGANSGNALTLVSGAGNFINNLGAGALSAPSGRWLVYSQDPALDSPNGLTSAFKQYDASFDPSYANIQGASEGFIYTLAPIITLIGVTKTYDGTTTAPLAPGDYRFTGAIDGDSVTLSGSGNFVTANAGTRIQVTIPSATAAASNGLRPVYGYQVGPPAPGNTIGMINPAALTITANNQTKSYGQRLAFTGTEFVANGLQNGETVGLVTLNSAGAAATAQVAGNPYAINASNATGGTFNANNYTIGYVGGALTIDPKALTVSLSGIVAKTYDGTVSATLAPVNFALDGFVVGQAASITQSSGAYAVANAGSGIVVDAAVTPGDFSAAPGTMLSNYVLPSVASGLVGTIYPARLTYRANGANRIVGAPNPPFTGEVTGLVHGDTLAGVATGTPSFTSPATASSGAGFYAIDGFGLVLVGGNYVLAQAPSNADALVIAPPPSFTVNPSTFASYARLYLESIDFDSRFASPDCDPIAISMAFSTSGHSKLIGEDASCH
jgi:hypothetical protein